MRTDRAPLAQRFPALGKFAQVRWQGVGARRQQRTGRRARSHRHRDPGPDRADPARRAGPEGRLLLDRVLDRDATDPTDDLDAELRAFVPPSATWQRSDQFTTDVAGVGHQGKVLLDASSATVLLDISTS